MSDIHSATLSGTAHPVDVRAMLNAICEHFVEHSDVLREEGRAVLMSRDWTINLTSVDDRLEIVIATASDASLPVTCTMFAEHLFYFAGDEPLSLEWSEPAPKGRPPGFHEATVVSARNVTSRMRRVVLSVENVTSFIGGNMHVRLLIPPKGRAPVWPIVQQNGRIGWPEGEDELLMRIYTIRSVDAGTNQVSVDVFQHSAEGIATPGSDFARDAQPGDRLAIMGPGGGGLPDAQTILFAGDESALPAIARMVEEAAPGTLMKAIIEVEDGSEQQDLEERLIGLEWLHRSSYSSDDRTSLVDRVKAEVQTTSADTFVWFAGEKSDCREIKRFLADLKRDRKNQYVAWYWERNRST